MDLSKNFAKGTVSAGYTSTATSIALAAGNGGRFPSTAFNAVWWNSTDYPDPSDDPNVEIVRVTARSSDTLTIVRAQEGTSAANHNTAGKVYKVLAGLTADTLNTLGGVWDFTGPQRYAGQSRFLHPITGVPFDTQLNLEGCLGFIPYWLNAPMSLASATINHTAGLHSSATLKFCLYSADPVTKYPQDKVANSDLSFSLSASGVKTGTYSPSPVLPRGLTWGAYVCSAPKGTVNPKLVAAVAGQMNPIYQSLFGYASITPTLKWGAGGIYVPESASPPSTLPASATSLAISPAGTHIEQLTWGVAFIVLKEA
jgi:hypothetical protein